MSLHFNKETLLEYVEMIFPQIAGEFQIDHLDKDLLIVRLLVQERHLRPGGTVSGPSMFSLADISVYLSVLAAIGPEALTVTTSCSLDFMHKPAFETDLLAHCKLLKLGKSLAVGDVLIYSDGMHKPVARATMTYSIPRAKSAF